MAQTADELLTVEEAAEHLGVTVGRLYQLRQTGGDGPLSWIENRRLVYPKSQLDAYQARRRERSMRGAVSV